MQLLAPKQVQLRIGSSFFAGCMIRIRARSKEFAPSPLIKARLSVFHKEAEIPSPKVGEGRGLRCTHSSVPVDSMRCMRSEDDPEDAREPMDRTRWWELSFSIRGFENVTVETLKLFWTVSLGSENPKKHRNRVMSLQFSFCACGQQKTVVDSQAYQVRLQTKFSSIFTLEKGKVFTADNPILMYERKTFALSYKVRARLC